MPIQVKLREGITSARRDAVLKTVEVESGLPVNPLFPGLDDPELASIYRVETKPDPGEASLVDKLNGLEDVEFAEPDVQRRLID
jgi:hypothetical protein